jgi:hypothetical protein
MLKFRLYIFKDPDAKDRGYSLAGIKIPLTTFCPVKATPNLVSYDDGSAYGPYSEYWKVPCSLLILTRPDLSKHLKGITNLLVPTDWIDIAPVSNY